MNGLNWLLAIKRLYFVIWAIAIAVCLLGVITELTTGGNVKDRAAALGTFIVIPYLLMKASSWVYQGLFSKNE
jgi:hypothetical protein